MEGERATETWQQRLRASGHRLTPQRELVLDAVETLKHATPDQVYDHVRRTSSAINLSTIYRTLELLDELGLIKHTHIQERVPTYHSVTGHEHFHLVCRGCGEVTSLGEESLRPFADRIREERGFEVDVGHLTIFGTCAKCVAASPESSEPGDRGSGPV